MTRRGRLLFIVLVVVQVVVIVGLAAGREITLRGGEDVTLQTRPVDPRDLFRGDYAILDYEIGRVDTDRLDWLYLDPGDTVYVELVQRGDVWVTGRFDRDPFDEFTTQIRGTIVRASTEWTTVDYGIGEYFVPEGTGRTVERAADVKVVVALDRSGGPVIRHLIIDGEVWDPHG